MLRHVLLTCLLLGMCAAAWATARAAEKTVFVNVQVDSEHAGYEGYRAADGDAATMRVHTEFSGANPPGPHQITLDLALATRSADSATCRDRAAATARSAATSAISAKTPSWARRSPWGLHTEGRRESGRLSRQVKGAYFRLRAMSSGRPALDFDRRTTAAGRRGCLSSKDAGPIALVHEDGTPMSETEIQYVSLLRDLRNRGNSPRQLPRRTTRRG